MGAGRQAVDDGATRWLARAALLLATAAVVTPLVLAGLGSLLLLAWGLVAVGLTVAALWWALAHRGTNRLWGMVVAALALLGIAIVYLAARFFWIVVLSAVLWLLAAFAARAALRGADLPPMPERETPPPRRPYLIMNPRSGGGKVGRFNLVERAQAAGARVALLDGPGPVDVTELARAAVRDGADLLGVAGGDGTQALVAGVAAEQGVPFLVISAGTRNHLALDLGLDVADPTRCLDALTDGVELRMDLGRVAGRPFVNNASFGAYAEVVRHPDYRDDKVQTVLRELPDLLLGESGPRLSAWAGTTHIQGAQAVLVSNNRYGRGDPAGMGRRPRLDQGSLGVIGVHVDNAVQAASLIGGTASRGLSVGSAREVVVTADAPEIAVGVDGEALLLPTPVRCTIEPGVLRVRVPRHRPGRTAATALEWRRVGHLASGLLHRAGHGADRVPVAKRAGRVAG